MAQGAVDMLMIRQYSSVKKSAFKTLLSLAGACCGGDAAVYSMYGTVFQHPRTGLLFSEPRCFLLNYADLEHRMTIKLIWI